MAESPIFCVIQGLEKLVSSESRLSKITRDQLDRIKLKLRRLHAISKIADARQHEDDSIRDWVSKTREFVYDTEDLLEKFAIDISLRKERSVLRKPSEKNLTTFQDIESKISSRESDWQVCNIGFIDQVEILNSVSQRRQEIRRSYSHHDEDFVGLDEDVEELVARVVNEDGGDCCHVVSIIGIGGIGKTALARRMYHHGDIRGHFEAFAWACISKQWQLEEVLKRILCKLVPDKREQICAIKDNSELIKELFEVQKTKKCLVVLDDVWETDVWDSLRPAFPNRKMGSKVLLTTRNKEIAVHIDTDTRCYFYEQRHLNEDESWELLQKKALPVINIAVENDYASGSESEEAKSSNGSFLSCLSADDEDEFLRNLSTLHSEDSIQDKRADKHELGKEMVKQCGGLPLAITVLGGILMTKSTLEDWEAVHQSFNSHLRERGIGENGRVYELLALSYHDLPYQIKQCFWHLGNFPKYYNIPTRKLYQLWAAEGFISPPNSHSNGEEKSIMEIAERHLCELEQRCMVQVQVEESTGCIKSCQLHDFVREICILKGDQENFLKRLHLSHESELNRTSSSSSEATSSSYSATHSLPIPVDSYAEVNLTSERESLEHVRSALFFSRLAQRENLQATLKYLCDGLKLLRILDLERFEFGEELYEAIGNLLHLRYLGLKGSRFNKLPSSIGNLIFLQTLDLRTSFDSYLIIPDVLFKLNQLKHLYLPPSQSSTNKLNLSTLKNLEILKNFDPRVSNFRDISGFNKLRKLTLIFCLEMENLKAINKYLRTNSNLLTDSSFRIHYNFKSAKELALLNSIVGCNHLRKLDLVGQIEKLPEHVHFSHRLTKLTLRNSALKEDPMTILEKLPNLHFLTLRKNAVIGNRVRCSAQGFARLRSIEFQGLVHLEEWIIEEGSMRNLLRLTIDECSSLKMVPEGIKFLSEMKEVVIANMPDDFKQRVGAMEESGHNLYKVTVIETKCNGKMEFQPRGAGNGKPVIFRNFSPSIVPKNWQNT